MKTSIKKNIVFGSAAFLLPALLMAYAFYKNGIYPGSDMTLLIYDMDAQYVSFFGYLHNLGKGYNNLMYQTLSGMNGSYFGTWAYYTASPLSFLVLLFDLSKLPDALYFLTLIKISLCGLTFFIYSKLGRLKSDNSFICLIASLSYALIGFNTIYAMNLMWLDGVIMLPLVILGADYLFKQGNPLFLISSLFLTVIFNYYTAYMIVLYLIIYFCFICFSYKVNVKVALKIGIRFLISGILSLLISAVVLLPVILDLKNGKLSESAKELSGIIRTPFSVLRSLLPFSYGGMLAKGNPPLYCGLIVLFVFVAFFVLKSINKNRKIAALIVISLFFFSLCWDKLDIVFHGFRIPDCYPSRYSFIISFFIISVSLESMPLLIEKISANRRVMALSILLIFNIVDLSSNAAFIISSLNSDSHTGGYVERLYYDYYYLQSEYLKNNFSVSSERTYADIDFNYTDGLLFGIPSIDYYSSSYNLGMSDYLRGMGLDVIYNIERDQGLCPLSASYLGVDVYYNHFNDSELPYFADYFEYDSESGYYRNNHSIGAGSLLISDDINSDDFSYNVFDNLNLINYSFTGVDEVFLDCVNTSLVESFVDENGYFIKQYSVDPVKNCHLYFYVSPANYYESGDLVCDDRLYLGDTEISSYTNVGNRYMVDLGISDGTSLTFTLKSDSKYSEAYIYSFDDEAYYKSMDILGERCIGRFEYTREGISTEFDSVEDGDLILMLPYEKGYSIYLDGEKITYKSFMDALVKVSVTAGHHTIFVKYTTPGLVSGVCLTILGIILSILYIAVLRKRKDGALIGCSLNECESNISTTEKKKTNKQITPKCIAYILSFLIPVVCAAISFWGQDIYLGGPNTILIYDLKGQIVSFYGYLSHLGEGYNTLIHTMSGGLGGNFWGAYAYYYSPLDFIYSLVDIDHLPDAVYCMTLLRIGLCGLFASVYSYDKLMLKFRVLLSVFISCCYALMAYNFAYSMLPMWFDCIALLPLLALCVDRIVSGKSNYLFVFLLSLCIFSNYYIAFMNVCALCLYFVYKCFEENLTLKIAFKRFGIFSLFGIIGAGLSSFILVPSVFDLLRGRVAEGSIASANLLIKNGAMEIIKGIFPMSYHTLASDMPPYIYCGSVIAVLSLLWLLDKSVRKKTKIFGLVVLAFYFASFILGPLDRAWHGFQDPVGFSCRYSFTYVFILIAFSIRSLNFIYAKFEKTSLNNLHFGFIVLTLYTIVELTLNGSYLVSSLQLDYHYSVRNEYSRNSDAMTAAYSELDNVTDYNFYRFSKNFSYSVNDGMLFGYNGLQSFSSSYNSSAVNFLRNVGLDSFNSMIQETGLTPPLADLLDVEYYYSYWFDKSDCYELADSYGPYYLYRNQNALPLGIVLNSYDCGDKPFASLIPFENINGIFSDISGLEEASVFEKQDYEIKPLFIGLNLSEENADVLTISFVPERSGRYFIYRAKEYVPSFSKVEEVLPSDVQYLKYSLDGGVLGNYGYNHHRFIGDLGYLNAGQSYTVSFDDPDFAEGTVYLYYYNDELCSSICEQTKGFEISKIGKNGIVLSGTSDNACDLLVTLPFEDGYKISVNDNPAKVSSFRGSLILLHLDEGESIIRIKYEPKGLRTGIYISVISLILLILLLIYDVNKHEINKNHAFQDE